MSRYLKSRPGCTAGMAGGHRPNLFLALLPLQLYPTGQRRPACYLLRAGRWWLLRYVALLAGTAGDAGKEVDGVGFEVDEVGFLAAALRPLSPGSPTPALIESCAGFAG